MTGERTVRVKCAETFRRRSGYWSRSDDKHNVATSSPHPVQLGPVLSCLSLWPHLRTHTRVMWIQISGYHLTIFIISINYPLRLKRCLPLHLRKGFLSVTISTPFSVKGCRVKSVSHFNNEVAKHAKCGAWKNKQSNTISVLPSTKKKTRRLPFVRG